MAGPVRARLSSSSPIAPAGGIGRRRDRRANAAPLEVARKCGVYSRFGAIGLAAVRNRRERRNGPVQRAGPVKRRDNGSRPYSRP